MDKCIMCNSKCDNVSYYLGWDPICSEKCYSKFIKESEGSDKYEK